MANIVLAKQYQTSRLRQQEKPQANQTIREKRLYKKNRVRFIRSRRERCAQTEPKDEKILVYVR